MSKTKLNEFHKAYIEKYIGQKSAKEMAKVMDGIGEKTVQKYMNEVIKNQVHIDIVEEKKPEINNLEKQEVPISVLARAQLDIMNAKKGVTIMTNEASQIVDEERKVIPDKTDWRGKVATISHDRRKPKNVIVD